MQPSDSNLAARHDSAAVLPLLPAEFLETRWYAAYTNPRHEKHVAVQMDRKCIECFVPLYRSVRRWKDRRKELELPLFPGYVFVHMALRDRLQVLNYRVWRTSSAFMENRRHSRLSRSKRCVMGWSETRLPNPIRISESDAA